MTNYTVTTGPKAYSFHDQATGITIIRGQEKELTIRQYTSKKIQRALATGHLVLVANKNLMPKISETDLKRLDKKMRTQFSQGMELSKMAKGYTLDQVKALASEKYQIEADSTDTVETLIQAITEEFSKEDK